MRVLIACDSFKDALPASGVASAIARGVAAPIPMPPHLMPLSDGGEGVLDILRRTLSLKPVTLEVADALGRPVKASYGLSADGNTALVEMAEASGLERLTLAERDPLRTSTYGTGQLLADAKARGVRRVLLAIGGSATNDAGVGAAAALGWQFLDAAGKARASGWRQSAGHRAHCSAGSACLSRKWTCCATSPIRFTARTALPGFMAGKKAATIRAWPHLDEGLRHIAALMEEETGRKGLAETTGAGAAGGWASAPSPS